MEAPSLTVCIDVGRGGFAWATAGDSCDSGKQPVELREELDRLKPRALSVGMEAPLAVPEALDPSGHSSKEQRNRLVREREADPAGRAWFLNSGGATGMMAIPIFAWILSATDADIYVWEAMVTSPKPKVEGLGQDRSDAVYGAHQAHRRLEEAGKPSRESRFATPAMVARELQREGVEVTGLIVTVTDKSPLWDCGSGCQYALST